MRNPFSDLRLTWKMALIVLVSLLLFMVPASRVWQRTAEDLAFTEGERAVLPLVDKTMHLLQLAQQQRLEVMLAQAGSGQAEAASALRSLLDELGREERVRDSPALRSVLERVGKAAAEVEGARGKVAPAQLFALSTRLIDTIRLLQEDLYAESGLILDPAAVSFFLFDAGDHQLPQLIESLAKMRDHGALALATATGGHPDPEALAQAAAAAQDVSSRLTQFGHSLERAAAEQVAHDDQEMATRLGVIRQQSIDAVDAASGHLARLQSGNKEGVTARHYADAFGALIGRAFVAQRDLGTLFDGELVQRIDAIRAERQMLLAELGGLLALMVVLSLLVVRSIVRPISQAVTGAMRIAEGDFADTGLARAGHSETSRLLQALDAMRNSLAESLGRERAAAAENALIRTALDQAGAAVMIGDTARRIVYANQSVRVLLGRREAEIRTVVPRFSAHALQDHPLDAFDARITAAGQGAQPLSLQLGQGRFSLQVSRVTDAGGALLGTAVEWRDETDALAERAREQEVAAAQARVLSALDNTTVNIMIADADRKIIYMNAAVTRMLRAAEADLQRVLPAFSVDAIIGSSMDAFHRNPAHQRSLLEGLTTAHRSQIKVGNRHFRLVANPIFDAQHVRLGSVVEWSDVTLEVATQAEVAGLIDAANRGDFKVRLAEEGKEGFFAMLATSLNRLMSVTDRGLSEVMAMLRALADGDLTRRIEGDYEGAFQQLKEDGNATATNLAGIIGHIKQASDTISMGSREIAEGNLNLSQRTETQAASLEETASSMEELTATVKLNADNAREANRLAQGASEIAVKGGAIVGEVVTTMEEINASAKKIVDIISVIDGIAFQTNILALNAAVEAARAGEQGRGFAVVASEVRNLAQRSAVAAREIKVLIGDSVGRVESGTRLVGEAGTTIREVVDSVRRVTALMGEISAASAEQSTGIEAVNVTITQMDDMTQKNAALVEQAAAAAQSMADQADLLERSVGAFRLGDQD